MFLKRNLENKVAQSLNNLTNQGNPSLPSLDKDKKKPPNWFGKDPKINYNKEFKRFGDEHMRIEAKIAKEYINQLRDPDILELQPIKRWNMSTKPPANDKQEPHELQKTLFEVRHGLKDVNILKPRDKRIELGVDSRNVYAGWNNTVQITQKEKEELKVESLNRAFQNTVKNWGDLAVKQKVIGSELCSPKKHPTDYHYQNPTHTIEEKNLKIRDFKVQNQSKKEELRKTVEYENPGASKEKVSAIVFRKMKSDLESELGQTMTKPFRPHQGIFTCTLNSFRRTQHSFEKTQNSFYSNNNSPDMKRITYTSNMGDQTAILKKQQLASSKAFGMTTTNSFFRKTNNFQSNNKFNETALLFNSKRGTQQDFNNTKGRFNSTGFTSNSQSKYQEFASEDAQIQAMSKTMSKCNSSSELFFRTLPTMFKPLPPLMGKKVEYFPKNKWTEEEYFHPGKYVS